ncbi:two-component system sensor histidine kinase/response regulator [Oxalicibacterium flavum]|uniref:Virulence sensor protein BvgS n=1 Tax=Oxalicibacterium flavum TaxID=179467 RepID=A0A8J2UMI9_9BURK|nr:response regulator [Oxalicibacterium flavum]GGB97590.1 two-component system sensor histidine kinase/response regulator [Oxalicibacterium flavum]
MSETPALDQHGFKRILARNITLPLAASVVSAGVFIALIVYLLSVLDWVEHTDRVIANANETSKLVVDMETGMRGFALTGDESFLSPYEIAKAKVAPELKNLKELVLDNPRQIDRLGRILALHQEWNSFAQSIIELRRTDNDVTRIAEVISSGRGKLQFEEIRREFRNFLDMEHALRQQRSDDAKQVTAIVVIAYLLFSLIVGGLLAMFGRRELTQLAGTYGDALTRHQQYSSSLEQQAWLRTGQSQLAEQGIGQMALPQLGRTVLSFLAQYIESAVAALYVREEDGSLRRVATYGFSKENELIEQIVSSNETLVGQTAQGKKLIRLDNVPDNYLKVTSGLGNGKPRHMILVPLNHEGTINGVVELGFLHAPRERDIEFLQLMSSSLGMAVEAALYRRRLQDLLAETQQLNEELQVQQEELRTANEELEEQSRVLEESQANLENQKAELEQTNEQLAEQTLSLDQKNAALLDARTALEERALALQRASRYKSEFLANMSHELRTPLNSSLILAKLLADNTQGNLNEEQVKFAQTIYSAGNDLLSLINDILDISKVEAGKLELSPEAIPLHRLAESLQMIFEPLASNKQLAFEVRIENAAPLSIHTDRQRLEQILKNLLSNAVKFTDAGKVSLAIAGNAEGGAVFTVTDSGIGIATDEQEIIFEAFRQADGTTSRKYGGTGLGLSISRDLAALLGGSIEVDSTPGKGSVFTLTLPATLPAVVPEIARAPAPQTAIQPAASPAEPAPAPVIESPAFPDDRDSDRNHARTVLVIEDDVSFARILYDLAHETHYRCLVSHGATDGLHMASTYLPDAILLDMGLPDGSGMTVLQALKNDSRTRHMPVHIVSASDRSEVALQMGAVGYVIKPTTREQLKEVFQKLENRFTQTTRHVLLVEDDARQRDSVTQLIMDDDVKITAVESGEEALSLLRNNVFDCMIIDLKLPDMQGEQLLQRMSEEDICSFPPVIVYTGRNLTRDEEADLLKYSRSIIIKGARSPERLLDEVTLFLHKVESELSAERQSMLRTVRSRDRVFEGRRILIVDDDVRNIFALTSALEQRGAVIEAARNGFEAIAKLDTIPDIDLVLMDVMMPGMDGLEATRRIRADARFQKLPIIAVTAKAMKDDQEQCLQAGASDYMAKPIDLDRLYSLLRVWMPSLERL